ncbi:MAG: magnesium transporter [Gammaproteobacteria bacterium]|nr:magnesium transporter [Gammaproteobacteria bacterium]
MAKDTSETRTDLEHVLAALEAGTVRQVQRLVGALHPAETAHLLEALPTAQRRIVFDLVPEGDQGEVLVELTDDVRASLVEGMEASKLVAASEDLDLDDLADFVGGLPEAVTAQVLHSLSQRDRDRLNAVLSYPEDSAGGIMNPETIAVRADVTLEVVMRYLRMLAYLPDKTAAIFVVDRNDRYMGALHVSRLLTRDPASVVGDVMDEDFPPIPASMTDTEVAREFKDRDLVAAPVVDERGQLIGQITVDDVVDVISEQADEDIRRLAGLAEEDDMFAPVFTSARRRAVWLGINVATAFLAASVVGAFRPTLDQVVVLAVLMPVVASMGGIAGNQVVTLMVRGLALGRIEDSNARWLLAKEIGVALINGTGWAVVAALGTRLFTDDWVVGAIVGAALVVNLLTAAITGFAVPLALTKLRIDPALAGTVVLTTVTDCVGFAAFLSLGTLFLT